MIQQAYVPRGGWTIWALGCEGISKSQVSRIGAGRGGGWLLGPSAGRWTWLDALTQKVREDGRIVNVSVVVATAVNGEVGTSEDGAFWLAFLRSLSARGLSGVELVVSDAHQGLRGAIAAVFGGASWNGAAPTSWLTRVPRRAQHHAAPSTSNPPPMRYAQLDRVTSQLHDRFPEVASLLDEAGPDVGLLQLPTRPLVIWIRSGWLRGSIYWVLLFRGRFFATKPLSQKHRSTFLPPQDANPTPSFGGFGLTLCSLCPLR